MVRAAIGLSGSIGVGVSSRPACGARTPDRQDRGITAALVTLTLISLQSLDLVELEDQARATPPLEVVTMLADRPESLARPQLGGSRMALRLSLPFSDYQIKLMAVSPTSIVRPGRYPPKAEDLSQRLSALAGLGRIDHMDI